MGKTGNYYLGLDIGTSSVGWAVSDFDYNLIKKSGKHLWGARLFEAGSDASERRSFRSARRRNARKKLRVNLLNDIFRDEINKIDDKFFLRMKESMFYQEDKKIDSKYSIFDGDYTDYDYYKEYPTIYHLRRKLMKSDEKYDIRLVYLALKHIIENRGHFLYEDLEFEKVPKFDDIYSGFETKLEDLFYGEIRVASKDGIRDISRDNKLNKTQKKNEMKKVFEYSGDNKKVSSKIAEMLVGFKVDLRDIFADLKDVEGLNDSDVKFSFDDNTFEEKYDILDGILGERLYFIEDLKKIYNWGLTVNILGECESISEKKIFEYDNNKADWKLIKYLAKSYLDEEEYKKIKKLDKYNDFREQILKSLNSYYSAYKKGNEEIDEQDVIIFERIISNKEVLSKLRNNSNGLVPFQFHLYELKEILKKSSKHYDFLKFEEDGISNIDKIISIMIFRIPYFVGPLNDLHKDSGYSWIVKNSDEKIYSWNFDRVVNKEKTAEAFIRKMTNKCSYLPSQDVLPKNSLLYREYMLLNDLNNIKINGKKLSEKTKAVLIDGLFKNVELGNKVTLKKFKRYMISQNLAEKEDDFSGIDIEFNTLQSYLFLKKTLGDFVDKQENYDYCEDIILTSTIFGESKKLYLEILNKNYLETGILSNEQILKLANKRFSAWGRFSKELLTDIRMVNMETGEVLSIMDVLRTKPFNFMELLSNKFDFSNKIDEFNEKHLSNKSKDITYDDVKDLYISPAVRRSVWQTVKLIKEIKKINGDYPKKIFVEVAREHQASIRTSARRDQMLGLYKSCLSQSKDLSEDLRDRCKMISEDLENKTNDELKAKKLYLYYKQMGKCMYTGADIDLATLMSGDVYDIDHIYPRSLLKDDSFDNLVLVKLEENRDKKNEVLSDDIRNKQKYFWKILLRKGFISQKKYDRLMKSTDFSRDELAGFINRQLVETRQSSKVVIDLLKRLCPDSDIVYVKAHLVSEFRQYMNLIKVRDLNDLHHAKDAYLNIVVGNAYDVKFTKNPYNFIDKHYDKGESYNLKPQEFYSWNIMRNGVVSWKRGKDGSSKTVRRVMNLNSVLISRKVQKNTGAIFSKNTIFSDGKIPLKVADKRFLDIEKYGGYRGESIAYFMIIEKGKENARKKCFEFITLRDDFLIGEDINKKIELCVNRGHINPRILVPYVPKNTVIEIDGFRYNISGRTNNGVNVTVEEQLYDFVEYKMSLYLKRIIKHYKKMMSIKGFKDKELNSLRCELTEKNEYINKEKNYVLYTYLIDKISNSKFKNRKNNAKDIIIDSLEKFEELDLFNQCILILEVLKIFGAKTGDRAKPNANLLLIGGSKQSCKINVSIIGSDSKLIYKSVSGFYERVVDVDSL